MTEGLDWLFVDPEDSVPFWLRSLDVFWLTSEPRSEGIPTVIGEAMATGIPVVSSDVGSVGEIVIDGLNGFIVPPRQPEAFAKMTARILFDRGLRESLAVGAVETAGAKFSVSKTADSYINAILSAINRKPGPPQSLNVKEA